jgi:hypothetical protein
MECYKATVNEPETITEAKAGYSEPRGFGFGFPAGPTVERS